MGGINEVDHATVEKAMAGRSVEEKNIIAYISTGTSWAREKLEEIGRAEHNRCELCGEVEHDIRHPLWDCPKIHEGDQFQCRQELKAELPTNLQFGIPGLMAKELNVTYWGTKLQDICTKDDGILGMIGLSGDKNKQNRQTNQNANAEEAYKRKGLDVNGCNARQAFKKFKGGSSKNEFPVVKKCDHEAPNKINVYSDGSYKNNRRAYFSLAGAGVWWPERDTDLQPITSAEYEMSLHKQVTGGIALSTALAGHGGSSTRAEIAAGIVACQSDVAINVG